jgi:hypothetical protein
MRVLSVPFMAIGYAHHADYGPVGTNGITTRSERESICRGGYAKDPTTSATIVRTVIAQYSRTCRAVGCSRNTSNDAARSASQTFDGDGEVC